MKEELKEKLDSQEFYDLMQSYRFANMLDQQYVIRTFNAVKEWILEAYEPINQT